MTLQKVASAVRMSVASLLLLLCGSCDAIYDDVIPAMPVNINLTNSGTWNTYGVAGYGFFRYFIKYPGTVLPAGFPYNQTSYTGYGGVLLISGMDPYTGETNVPMAYDMSCPVERSQTVRVYIDTSNLDAVCEVCGSHYNVVEGAGAPLSGPALSGPQKYKLKKYRCLYSPEGGYYITD